MYPPKVRLDAFGKDEEVTPKALIDRGLNIELTKLLEGESGAYWTLGFKHSHNHKRGELICTNKVQLRLDTRDSAILHAMNQTFDEKVLEDSVVMALEQIRKEETNFPKKRVTLDVNYQTSKLSFITWWNWSLQASAQIRSLNHCTKKRPTRNPCFQIWPSWIN